ncbi:right-handed parallel beta-helix repeat-containing protein [Myxococcaceae bacterium GXIMD 01537]
MNGPLPSRSSLLVLLLLPLSASAATLTVGPGKTHATPKDAAAVARDGDIIEISAGVYRDEAIWKAHGLTIRGVGGGRAHLDAAGLTLANRKAIWVIQGNGTTVENIEFSGASVPDKNGAGIRQEGAGLTVRNCYFHDNENGVLAGDKADSDILIESSEFARNGAGDGQSHNMYINRVRSFTLRFSDSHAARVGHLVKSRAYSTFILYNRLTSGDGNPSYEIDLPNGGRARVVGNQIHQGTAAENSTLLSFGAEGTTNPEQALFVINNTFVNDRTAGATFVRIAGTPTARVFNNLFIGKGTPLSGTATQESNLVTETPGLVDSARFDYHLLATSPAVNAGSEPGMDGTDALAPAFQYVHPLGGEPRQRLGSAWDVGAFEFGEPPTSPADGGIPSSPVAPGEDGGVPAQGQDGEEPPPDQGCGCATPAGASSTLALLLLVALGRRRTS